MLTNAQEGKEAHTNTCEQTLARLCSVLDTHLKSSHIKLRQASFGPSNLQKIVRDLLLYDVSKILQGIFLEGVDGNFPIMIKRHDCRAQ